MEIGSMTSYTRFPSSYETLIVRPMVQNKMLRDKEKEQKQGYQHKASITFRGISQICWLRMSSFIHSQRQHMAFTVPIWIMQMPRQPPCTIGNIGLLSPHFGLG